MPIDLYDDASTSSHGKVEQGILPACRVKMWIIRGVTSSTRSLYIDFRPTRLFLRPTPPRPHDWCTQISIDQYNRLYDWIEAMKAMTAEFAAPLVQLRLVGLTGMPAMDGMPAIAAIGRKFTDKVGSLMDVVLAETCAGWALRWGRMLIDEDEEIGESCWKQLLVRRRSSSSVSLRLGR